MHWWYMWTHGTRGVPLHALVVHADTRHKRCTPACTLYSLTTIMATHSAAHSILNILSQIPTEVVREKGKEGILHAAAMASKTASYSAHHILWPSMFVEQ